MKILTEKHVSIETVQLANSHAYRNSTQVFDEQKESCPGADLCVVPF